MNPTLRVKLVANKARYNGNRYPIGTEIEVTQSERDKRKFFFPRKDYYCYREDFEILGESYNESSSGMNFAQIAMGNL
jgi:hypothetical protein